MKILYGVAGDGMGHAIRSRVVIEHLLRAHDVRVVTSRRAHAFLASHLPDVRRIWGLEHAYGRGRVHRGRSALKALGGLCSGGVRNVGRLLRLLATEQFDLVISDFEPFSHVVGWLANVPVVTIDNIQALIRMRPGRDFLRDAGAEFAAAKAFVRLTTRGAFHHFVTSFFRTDPCDSRTTVVPPILRPEILRAKSERGSHLLVYQTAAGDEALAQTLRSANVECRCYGFKRTIDRPVRLGNVTHYPFSESGFVDDLRTAKGVVTNGGFTLLSEALHLKKPVFSIPLENQVEQSLNAYHLSRLGYGMTSKHLSPALLQRFLSRLETFDRSLNALPRWDNSTLFRRLDSTIDRLNRRRVRSDRVAELQGWPHFVLNAGLLGASGVEARTAEA